MAQYMSRGFASPGKYIQGPGEINYIEELTRPYTNKVIFVIDGFLYPEYSKKLQAIYEPTESECITEKFNGECSQKEIARIREIAANSGAGLVIGVGGGKTLDTAKTAAYDSGLPYIIVPTAASTDAPVSPLAVIYTEDGLWESSRKFNRNAEIVLVDSEIVAKAPIRLFKAGLGDALATWFEALAVINNDKFNGVGRGYRRTKAGEAIAKMCFDVLMEDGIKALDALKVGAVTEAVENVIEANTLLSGLGFFNNGCSVSHSIHAGLCEFPNAHKFLHGEKVNFGTVCLFIFENTPKEIVDPVMKFMIEAGLPVTLGQFDLEATWENAHIIANKSVNGHKTIYNTQYTINVDTVAAAVMAADELGKKYLAMYGDKA